MAGKDDILVVPVIRAAEKLSLTEIAEKSASLTKKGKEGSLRPDDMNNATIALSSLAMFGVNSFIAIPPADSNAIISVGRPEAKISIVDGKPVSEKFMSFCISANARVVSSFYCAKFLAEFARLVENPQLLAD